LKICFQAAYVRAALFKIARTWKQPKYPLADAWIKKKCGCTYNVILLNHKKEQNFAICSKLDGVEVVK